MATEAELKVKNEKAQQKAPAKVLSGELDMFRDFERRFDDFFSRRWLRPWHLDWPSLGEMRRALDIRIPSVDVIDGDREIKIKCELPGVDKKDLEVTATDEAVTIRGESRREEKEEKENYSRSEIKRGSFSRTIALPAAVDSAKAKASFKDGMLELVLPKVEERKRRTISIE